MGRGGQNLEKGEGTVLQKRRPSVSLPAGIEGVVIYANGSSTQMDFVRRTLSGGWEPVQVSFDVPPELARQVSSRINAIGPR